MPTAADSYRLTFSADSGTFFDRLSVDSATGVVGQPRQPWFRACTNSDKCIGVDNWTMIGINNTE